MLNIRHFTIIAPNYNVIFSCLLLFSKRILDEVLELQLTADTQAILVPPNSPQDLGFNFNFRPSPHAILGNIAYRRPLVCTGNNIMMLLFLCGNK